MFKSQVCWVKKPRRFKIHARFCSYQPVKLKLYLIDFFIHIIASSSQNAHIPTLKLTILRRMIFHCFLFKHLILLKKIFLQRYLKHAKFLKNYKNYLLSIWPSNSPQKSLWISVHISLCSDIFLNWCEYFLAN